MPQIIIGWQILTGFIRGEITDESQALTGQLESIQTAPLIVLWSV